MNKYDYKYHSASQKWPNTNIICLAQNDQLWILFVVPKGPNMNTNFRRPFLSSGEKKYKHHSINVSFHLWHITCSCRVVAFTQSGLKMAKSKPKKWKWKSKSFCLNIMFAFAFTFLADVLSSSTFFGSSEVTMLTKIYIVFKKKSQRYLVWEIMNMNNIRFEKITRIRKIFGFKKSPNYKYKY